MNINIINKSIIAAAAFSALATGAAAQLPNTFNYQAVVNAEDGSPVANKKITVEVSILQGTDCDKSNTCPVLWQELHYPTTSDFGLFSVEIGASDATNTMAGNNANYSDINWVDVSKGYYYLKVRADFGESEHLNSLSDLGTTKFSAVPYALAAQNADFAQNASVAKTALTAQALLTDNNGKISNKLEQLADVNIPSPQKNQILTFDGSKWTSQDPAAQGLTNIAITNPQNGEYLIYDGTNWVNMAVDMSIKLAQITDVSTTTPQNGELLTYSDGKWINKAAPKTVTKLSELTGDVKINTTTIADGNILTYNKAENIWENRKPAQWQATSNNGIKYTNGNVGIGDIDDYPTAMLELKHGAHQVLFDKGLSMGTTNAQATGPSSIALEDAIAEGSGSIAIGTSHVVLSSSGLTGGKNSLSIGDKNVVRGSNNSMAIGVGNEIETGDQCYTFGSYLKGGDNNSFTIGQYNEVDWDAVFVIGWGDFNTRNNIFVVKNDGTAQLNNVALTSDRRLKTNINPLQKSLDKVMKLNGVTFNWDRSNAKNSNASTSLQYGFVAQEIEQVLPELVSEGADGYKSVNYIGVIPVLTQAIQEQQTEIEQLKEENKKLNETIDALLKRVEALEKK